MGPVWETQMHPHLPGCNPNGSCVGKQRCTHMYPGVTHISPLWANPDAPISSRMLPTLVPCRTLNGPQVGFDTFAPSIDMGPVWETQMHQHLPGCNPHGSCVDKPRCTHTYPVLTHISPMWANQDAPLSFRMLPTLAPCGTLYGPQVGFQHFCTQH